MAGHPREAEYRSVSDEERDNLKDEIVSNLDDDYNDGNQDLHKVNGRSDYNNFTEDGKNTYESDEYDDSDENSLSNEDEEHDIVRRRGFEIDCEASDRKLESCIEDIKPEIIEKCMPGMANFNYTNRLPENEAAYKLQKYNSEICLKQIFRKCSQEARFRIKTKLKNLIGVNLNILHKTESTALDVHHSLECKNSPHRPITNNNKLKKKSTY
ncbi:uncharacterized protein [Parasteatoda tepidariorum]|uniref:uncharacterized protein n=1 Tax=Parasteatoda tepidariorum TaxID=114398 RepID=UPI0039BD10EA